MKKPLRALLLAEGVGADLIERELRRAFAAVHCVRVATVEALVLLHGEREALEALHSFSNVFIWFVICDRMCVRVRLGQWRKHTASIEERLRTMYI